MRAPAAASIGFRRGSRFSLITLSPLPFLLAAAIVVGVAYGASFIPLTDVVGIIVSRLGVPMSHTWSAAQSIIVWDIRLPEVITALLVGCALALSGTIFQAVMRNPLADPFVIGTSSGAAFAVALAEGLGLSVTWLGFGMPQIFAFLGALVSVALVFLLGWTGSRSGSLTLLLAGFAISSLMIAGMWLVAYESGRENALLGWMMGSLSASGWSQLTIVAPLVLGLGGLTLFFVRDLNALLLGEEQAGYLGLEARRSRLLLIGLATIMTALAVSLAGIVGFVGLVVPHIGRLLYGPSHQRLLISGAFLGGAFLIFSDVIARTAEPSGGELPLGIVTAFIGAPLFLYLLLRSGDSYAF